MLGGRLLLLISCVLVAALGPVAAQEAVRARGGGHDDFGRIVFDWPATVSYEAKIEGRNLIVRFARPMGVDLGGLPAALNNYVSAANLSSDNRTASIQLKGDYSLRTFENGNSVVVDVVRKGGAAAASVSPTAGTKPPPPLRVRKGQHPTYDRLVFDWTRPVDYEVSRDGKRVTLQFSRPSQIDLAALRAKLDRGFSNPSTQTESSKLAFSVDVKEGARIRHFRAGTKVVFDVFRDGDTQASAAPARPTEAKPEVKSAPVVPVTPAGPATESKSPALAPAQKPIRLVPKDSEDNKSEPKGVEEKQNVETARAQPSAPDAEAADVPVAAEVEKPADAETQATIPAAVTPAAAVKEEAEGPPPDPVTLVFEWSQEISLAAFRRNQYVWLVFGQRALVQTAPLLQQSRTLIERIDQVPSGQATILRVQTKNTRINVSQIQLNGTNWLIEFSQAPMQPSAQINFGVSQAGSQGAQLLMPTEATGQLFNFQDPDVGDILQVVTTTTPGLGMDGERAYPEFQILASAQGVAIETFNSDLVLNKLEKAIVFGGARGLYVSEVASVPSKIGASAHAQTVTLGAIGSQILQPAKWQRGGLEDLNSVRQELMSGIISVSPKRRAKGRIELAQYNFSHGLAQEALAILEVVEFTDLEAASTAEFLALKGATLALTERPEEAQKALNDRRLDEYQDIAIWRGAADHQAGDIAAASQNFDRGDPSLQNYPPPLKAKLLVQRLEVALDDGQLELAKQWRDRVTEELDSYGPIYKGRLSYLFGRLYRLELDFDNAVGAYQVALDSPDKWSSVQAEFDLVDLGLQQETIEVPEAKQRLERLRYAWRGGAFERKVLDRLGELYLSTSDYRNGLNTLKVIVTYFQKHPDAQAAAEKMRDVFRRLYLEGEADNISPLTALALYDEFRELTPAGPEGNLMIRKLAERLVDVDLLDKASDVLGHQVKFRLRGEEKAEVGTKLALIRLIARDPQGALGALRDSFYPNVSLQIENDRRRIRAKAEFELGKANDAIALLAGDISREADLLRSAIYFRERNWGEAGKVYQRLVGDPPENGASIAEELGRTVLLWAVALKLNRDEDGLRQLFELYGPGMRGSPLAATFEYIARPPEGSGFDLGSIQKQIADVDQFQAFMKNYRERLLKSENARAKPNAAADTPSGQQS